MSLLEILAPTAQGFYNNHAGPTGGPPTKAAALADVLDTTYSTQDAGANYDTFAMLDPTAGPTAVVATLIVWLRLRLQAASTNSGNLRIRSGGVDVTSPGISLNNAGAAQIREVSWDVTTLKPGGGVWTVPEIAALEAGQRSNTTAGAQPEFLRLWLELVTGLVPTRLGAVRRAISARILRYSRSRNRIVVPSAPEQLGVDLVTDMGFADRRGPTPDGRGWRPEAVNRRLGRVVAIEESLDPRKIDVRLEAEDLRHQLAQLVDGGRSSEAPSSSLDGVMLLDPSVAIVRTFGRASRVLVPSPVDRRITAVTNDVEGIGHRGRFHEGAQEQLVKDSVFRAGLGAWSPLGGGVSLASTETIFSPEVSGQFVRLVGDAIDQTLIPAPAGWIWISIDHREVNVGDIAQIRIRRASDSLFWDGATWVAPSTFIDLPASQAWIRSAVGPIDQTAGATTYTLRIRAPGGDECNLFCVQMEGAPAGKGWVSSRIDTEAASVTRAATSLTHSGDAWPDVRGSYTLIATSQWASANLVGAGVFTLIRVVRDANNGWLLGYDTTSHPGRYFWRKTASGVVYETSIVTALPGDTGDRIGVTWQSTDGENGDANYTIKLIVNGVETKLATADFPPGMPTGTVSRGSFTASTGHWNGLIERERLSPFVYTRDEIVRILS